MKDKPEITLLSWLMVATLGLVWGATFMVIEIALRGITPFWLATARIAFASGLMFVFWAARGWRLFDGYTTVWTWANLLFIGALSTAVPFMLISWGQQYVTSGFTGVSMAAVVLMVLPLAHVLIPGEQMTVLKTLGFLIGFAGVCVLIGGQAFDRSGHELEIWGRAACLGAAACYAVSSVSMRKLPRVDAVGLGAITLSIGTVIVLACALFVEGPPVMPDTQTILALAILGLIPTAAATMLRIWVIRSAGPTFMGLTNYQVPIWSILLGAVFLGEALPPSLLTAMALILGGMALSQWTALRGLFTRR